MSNTETKYLEFSPKDFQIYFGEKNYIHLTLGSTETIDNFAKAHYSDVNLVINYEHCWTVYSGCSLVGLKNLERKLIFAYYGKVEKFEMKTGNTGNVTIATGSNNKKTKKELAQAQAGQKFWKRLVSLGIERNKMKPLSEQLGVKLNLENFAKERPQPVDSLIVAYNSSDDILLEKAQQFIDSLPAHQKPVQMMRPYQYFLEAHGYIHLWFRNKEDTKEMHADLHPEGWVWYYTDDDDNDYGTDEGYDEELPPEFYARLNELFPEPK